MQATIRRAMALTAKLNRLTYDDADQVRSLFSELIGQPVDHGFLLIPPFYSTGGPDMRVGRNVFINQNCTFYDLGGLDIGDDVMIGPNVSITTSGHPLAPSQRRAAVVAKPIVIGRNVWIGEHVCIMPGVSIGDGAIIGAGAIVTKDIPANCIAVGTPAQVVRRFDADAATWVRLPASEIDSIGAAKAHG